MSTMLDYSSLDSKYRSLPPPPGFSSISTKAPTKSPSSSSETNASYEQLKEKRAWDFAIAPAKQLPMQAFMLYMSGGGVQIFSMGIVFMLLFSPFKNIAAINTAFAQFAPSSAKPASPTDLSSPATAITTLPLQKVAYVITNLLTLALGLWKCRQMGLLPTGTGDWLAFETRGFSPELTLL